MVSQRYASRDMGVSLGLYGRRRIAGGAFATRRRLFLLTLWAIGAAACSSTSKLETRNAFEAIPESSHPKAFLQGNELYLVYGEKPNQTIFEAEWKGRALEGKDHVYRSAQLKVVDKLPGGNLREARVLPPEQMRGLMRSMGAILVPPGSKQRVLVRLPDLEGVVFRDENDQVRLVPWRPPMMPLEADTVVNSAEFAKTATEGLDAYVKSQGREAEALVFATAGGPRPARYILFDLEKPKTVLVYLPTPGEAAAETSRLGTFAEFFRAGIIDGTLISLLKNPVSTTGRLINVVYQWIVNWGTRFLPGDPAQIPPLSQAPPMDLAAFDARLDKWDKIPKRLRGAIRLHINGSEYFPLLEQRIREAASSIHIVMCIFDTDDYAIRVADMLRERSKEIETHVIVDRFSSLGSGRAPPDTPMPADYVAPPSIQTYLRTDSKVEVRNFLNPWATAEHSKVLMFDRKYAHLGGMNIGREYRYSWHDMMVELEGPIVGWYEKRFQFAWAHASTLGDFATAWDSITAKEPPGYAGAAERDDYVDLRPLRTETFDTEILKAVRHAIQSARSYIYVENPYIFENAIVNDLIDARRRGVDVRVIVPSEADADAFDSSNKTTSNVLVANGIRVFIYPGMTHVKAILVDGWACVGSANFNKLSLRTNIETNVATSDPKFASELKQKLFDVDFEKSREVTEAYEVSWSDWLSSFILDDF